jgi:hypothetical protein
LTVPQLIDWKDRTLIFDDGSTVALPRCLFLEAMVDGREVYLLGCRGDVWESARVAARAEREEVEAAVSQLLDDLNRVEEEPAKRRRK